MSRAQRILQFIEQEKDEPYDREAGSSRSQARISTSKDNVRRKKLQKKLRNQYVAGVLPKKDFQQRKKRIRKAVQKSRRRLKNSTFKPELEIK